MKCTGELTGTQHRLPVASQDQLVWIMRLDGMLPVLSRVDHTNTEEANRKRELILLLARTSSKTSNYNGSMGTYYDSQAKCDSPDSFRVLLVIACENN